MILLSLVIIGFALLLIVKNSRCNGSDSRRPLHFISQRICPHISLRFFIFCHILGNNPEITLKISLKNHNILNVFVHIAMVIKAKTRKNICLEDLWDRLLCVCL